MIAGIIISSFIITYFSLYSFQKLYLQKGFIDKVNKRSSHNVIATRNGGIGIFSSIFFISCFYYIQGFELFNYSSLVALSILLVVGCYDDIYDVDFKLKFIFQIIAAKILIDNGYYIDNLHGFMGIGNLDRISSQFISILIIVAIINAINFIDGIDGLAISVVALFISLFEILSIKTSGLFYLSIILLGTVLPILIFNYKKNNKIFLGDSGSLFLGGITSIYVMHILSNDYLIINQYDINKLFFVISILFYPIVDITRVIVIRLYKGVSPFKADKNHIHHFLLNYFNNHFKVVLMVIIISLINFKLINVLFN